jgi:eukaryotic-like serine/threonine-protein kinase
MSSIGSNDVWGSVGNDAWSVVDGAQAYAHGVQYQEGDLIADKYRLLRKVGEGAMGTVWAAANTALESNVAIKLIRPEVRSAELGEYLLREAHAAAQLNHAAVVRIFDLGETESGDLYLVMELIEGESLRRALAREGQMAPERAISLLLPVAAAMHAAHERGIVHRDLKPDNVMLTRGHNGRLQPKVIDFGVAKILRKNEDPQASVGFEVFGTPDYMPPEQALALASVDRRADVWSFCAMLYELLAGRPPFSSKNALDGLRAAIQEPVRSLVERCGLDATLWAIIERGLRKELTARWASMRELGEALAAWLWSRGVGEDVCGMSLHTEWLADAQRELSTGPRSTRCPAPRSERGGARRRWPQRPRTHGIRSVVAARSSGVLDRAL